MEKEKLEIVKISDDQNVIFLNDGTKCFAKQVQEVEGKCSECYFYGIDVCCLLTPCYSCHRKDKTDVVFI